MRPVPAATLLGLAGWAIAISANAGAWPVAKDKTQVILKAEFMAGDEGFNADGDLEPLPARRRDNAIGVFVEHGLGNSLTLQFKADHQDSRDDFIAYQGRSPIEVGLRWTAWRNDQAAMAIYAGYAHGGDRRIPQMGDHDWELRLLAGRSLSAGERRPWIGSGGFVEIQVARRFRDGVADETRTDATLSLDVRHNWQIQTQVFAGASDAGARWLHTETSAIRRYGAWSAQAGWRSTISGRETPASSGPIVALWRRF